MPKRVKHDKPIYNRETLRFLRELKANNERPWFEANRHRYERHVLEPSLALIERMAPAIDKLSKHFLAIPKRSAGSLMRVYRDARFTHDKSPYKTNIGIQFRHERGKDVHAPGFYLHIEPDGCFLGAGIWRPEPKPLHDIRARIVAEPKLWQKVVTNRRFREVFELSGEQLARPPRGFSAAAPHVEDLKRKDFIAIGNLEISDVLAADLPARVATRFRAATPLMAFLCGALHLQY
jgi:uncharacterized protein (TIGR02453 family)